MPGESPSMVPTSVGKLAVWDGRENLPPLFLWPSLFADHHLYDRLLPLLQDRWRVIRFDGPGFGRSEPPRPDTQPDVYAAAVVEAMDQLGLDRAVFAGTSWGGQIGAYLAADHAPRIVGVLMMNTPLLPSRAGHLFEVALARLFTRTRFAANGVTHAMLPARFRREHPEFVRHVTDRFATFEGRAAGITTNTVMRRFSGLGDVLPRINAPLTILLGGDDPLYPAAELRPLAEQARTARVIVVDGCGHLAPLEAPEAVARHIEDFRLNS